MSTETGVLNLSEEFNETLRGIMKSEFEGIKKYIEEAINNLNAKNEDYEKQIKELTNENEILKKLVLQSNKEHSNRKLSPAELRAKKLLNNRELLESKNKEEARNKVLEEELSSLRRLSPLEARAMKVAKLKAASKK